MLHKRPQQHQFPDPSTPDADTFRGVIDWGMELAVRCKLPVPDPENPADVSDLTRMVVDYCSLDVAKQQALEPFVRKVLTEYRPDYLVNEKD